MKSIMSLPAEPDVILETVEKSLRFCPKAYTQRDKYLIELCRGDKKWHESSNWRERMIRLYNKVVN